MRIKYDDSDKTPNPMLGTSEVSFFISLHEHLRVGVVFLVYRTTLKDY